MSSQVFIKNDSGSLILGPLEHDYLSVSFHSDNLKFEVKPYLYNDAPNLVLFFQEMVNDWKHWSGVKVWKSVEGDLKFDATHDVGLVQRDKVTNAEILNRAGTD